MKFLLSLSLCFLLGCNACVRTGPTLSAPTTACGFFINFSEEPEAQTAAFLFEVGFTSTNTRNWLVTNCTFTAEQKQALAQALSEGAQLNPVSK